MLILSATDAEAYSTTVELLREKALEPLACWLGPMDGDGRAARLNILWSGFLISCRLMPGCYHLSASGNTSTCRWLEQAIQAVVDEGRT